MSKVKLFEQYLLEREFTSKDKLLLTKDFEKYKIEKSNYFKLLNKFQNKLKQLIDSNKLNLKYNYKKLYDKINISVSFTDKIFKDYLEVINLYNNIYYYDIKFDSDATKSFYFNIENTNLNRTHFPDGLPKMLKGLNLGYYMYKNLAKNLKFISSEADSSNEVKIIWEKLLKDEDFYSIYIKKKYDDYKIIIIYKIFLNDIKKYLINYFIKNSDFDNILNVILDKKLLTDLKFTKENFSIGKNFYECEEDDNNPFLGYESDDQLYLNLCGFSIAEYNKKKNKWIKIYNFPKQFYDIIKRDANKFLKEYKSKK